MTEHTNLPAKVGIRNVSLRTSNSDQLKAFYTKVIGLSDSGIDQSVSRLSIGAGGADTITLLQDGDAVRHAKPGPGLFHFALLLPERAHLGQFLLHLAKQGYQLHGASDHIVSEALYLSDPDGNGIEVYWDRPRSEWIFTPNGQVQMGTNPLDLDSLIKEGEAHLHPWSGLPTDSKIGHMHLQVSDVVRSSAFYHDLVGFDMTQVSYPGARFLSAGGYHHHLGLNQWHTAHTAKTPRNAVGMSEWLLHIPDENNFDALTQRLKAANALEIEDSIYYAIDPDDIRMAISTN